MALLKQNRTNSNLVDIFVASVESGALFFLNYTTY